jgi:hypothetical protein
MRVHPCNGALSCLGGGEGSPLYFQGQRSIERWSTKVNIFGRGPEGYRVLVVRLSLRKHARAYRRDDGTRGGGVMNFDELLEQVLALVQRQGRVSYRSLKRRFDLDDAYLEDLKEEIIYAKRLAVDEDGRVLVWTGGADVPSAPTPQSTSWYHPLCPTRPVYCQESPPQPSRLPWTPNAVSSPCCFVTWSARPRSRRSLTPKSSGKSCGPTKRPAAR